MVSSIHCLPFTSKDEINTSYFHEYTFHGCFEDAAHDYCHFATLYMAVRF